MKITYQKHDDEAKSPCVYLGDKCNLPAHYYDDEFHMPDALESHIYSRMQAGNFTDSDIFVWVDEWREEAGIKTVDHDLMTIAIDRILRKCKRNKLVAYNNKTRSMEWIGVIRTGALDEPENG